MTLQKFKTFKEAEQALWNFNPDDAYYKKIKELFELMTNLTPLNNKKGIYKFKTLASAEKHRYSL